MSDRRAVSAGHHGASSVAAAQEAWRVAVGGNRVESMTVEQIAHAFHSGHLNVRTPLWPPGSTGWQALGNFPEFQQMHPSAYADPGLSQFVEADDDPTRMWTGGNDLPSMEAAMQAPFASGRPSAQTGVRQVMSRAPGATHEQAYANYSQPNYSQPMQPPPVPSRPGATHSQPAHSQAHHSQPMQPPAVPSRPVPSRPAPTASVASHQPALVPSNPPFRSKSRGNGLLLVAGLVGLVGLGSAVLAARGNWGSSQVRADEVAVSAESPSSASTPAPAEAAAAQPAAAQAEAPKGEAQLAKYEDTSAFVAGEAAKPAAANSEKSEAAKLDEPKADAPEANEPKADEPSSKQAKAKSDAEESDETKAKSEKASKAARARSEELSSKRLVAREKKRAATLERRSKPMARVEKAIEKPEAPEKAEKPERTEKVEKVEKAEKAVASEAPQAPASSAVNEAAAAALANSANLASSCRPRGGPAGSGKARVIYSNDGEVQSVEILTAKFRDTVTGSCVRMVFRRAKIPPFKGEPPTFIKSFTVPEE